MNKKWLVWLISFIAAAVLLVASLALRHLFARVFYGIEKDIVKLADFL